MLTYAYVALGSALGGMARYWVTLATIELGDGIFPWGTLGINIAGSLVIGLFFALSLPSGALQVGMNARAFVMTGLCGGFTTFSAFSLQSLELLRHGRYLPAFAYAVGSVVLCVAAAGLGYGIGERLMIQSAGES